MFADSAKPSGLVIVSDDAPENPLTGDLWLRTTDDVLLVWDGTQWVAVQGFVGSCGNYVPLSGAVMDSGDGVRIEFSPATTDGTETVINGGQGALSNCWIDGGVY